MFYYQVLLLTFQIALKQMHGCYWYSLQAADNADFQKETNRLKHLRDIFSCVCGLVLSHDIERYLSQRNMCSMQMIPSLLGYSRTERDITFFSRKGLKVKATGLVSYLVLETLSMCRNVCLDRKKPITMVFCDLSYMTVYCL